MKSAGSLDVEEQDLASRKSQSFGLSVTPSARSCLECCGFCLQVMVRDKSFNSERGIWSCSLDPAKGKESGI
nr:hypothetical protein CFP56_11856 [Quercus suber]